MPRPPTTTMPATTIGTGSAVIDAIRRTIAKRCGGSLSDPRAFAAVRAGIRDAMLAYASTMDGVPVNDADLRARYDAAIKRIAVSPPPADVHRRHLFPYLEHAILLERMLVSLGIVPGWFDHRMFEGGGDVHDPTSNMSFWHHVASFSREFHAVAAMAPDGWSPAICRDLVRCRIMRSTMGGPIMSRVFLLPADAGWRPSDFRRALTASVGGPSAIDAAFGDGHGPTGLRTLDPIDTTLLPIGADALHALWGSAWVSFTRSRDYDRLLAIWNTSHPGTKDAHPERPAQRDAWIVWTTDDRPRRPRAAWWSLDEHRRMSSIHLVPSWGLWVRHWQRTLMEHPSAIRVTASDLGDLDRLVAAPCGHRRAGPAAVTRGAAGSIRRRPPRPPRGP